MTPHCFLPAAALLLALSVPAQQEPEPQPTTGERIEALRGEKARLEQEIQYARERSGKAKTLLAKKLGPQHQEFRAIDAGTPAIARPLAPAQVQRKLARIATDEELGSLPGGTLLTVNGRPVAEHVYLSVMTYLRETPATGDDALRAQRTLYDLIRTEGVASQFIENEGEVRLAEVLAELETGKTVAELAARYGSVPTAVEGRVEVTRNSIHGPVFEQIAFTTQPGTMARPFYNSDGYVVMHVDSVEKGASPNLDKVIAHVILLPFTQDTQVLQKAKFAMNSGQVEVVVRDQETLDLLPALFKPQPTPAVRSAPTADTSALMTQLEALQKQIAEVEALGGEGVDEKLEVLRQNEQRLREYIEKQKAQAPQTDDVQQKTEELQQKIDAQKAEKLELPAGGAGAPKKGG